MTATAKYAAAFLLLLVALGTARAEDDYSTLLGNSFIFYEGQMSGSLPAWNRLLASKPGGYKKNGHLNDGAPINKDLSGGFYDAGDYLKCPLPLGWALANLAWSTLEFRAAYDAAGQLPYALNLIRWGTDWLMKAHVTASDTPAANVFVGQLADSSDHSYFGRPEHDTKTRQVYTVTAATGGADVASEYAAAFAAAAVLFRNSSNAAYAAVLFKRAQQAFAFAEAYQKNWVTPPGVFQAYVTYATNGYLAHVSWASAWMCKYDSSYCTKAEKYFSDAVTGGFQYSLGNDWDSVLPGAAVLMTSMGLQANAAKAYLENSLLAKWQDTSSICPKPAYSAVCYTPKGLAYYSDWGTLRNTGNMMFIAALMGKYADAGNRQKHICWTRMQMRYITGSLPNTGKSYVIGYGPSQPQRPHHRQSACNAAFSAPCNPSDGGTCCAGEQGVGAGGCCTAANFFNSHAALIKITGALVGGPDQSDNYPDLRPDYQRSEVALDYNAGFTGAAAALAQYAAAGQLAACGAGPATPQPPQLPPSPSPTPRPSPSPALSNPSPTPKPSPSPSPSPRPSTPSPSPAGVRPSPSPSPSPPPVVTPQPPNNGSSCTRTVQAFQQCGGLKDGCTSCSDVPWPVACCASGYKCTRDNAWYWMCSVDKAAPQPPASPSPPPPGGSCSKPLPLWSACGGKSGCPADVTAAGKCLDAQWAGYCCPSGAACVRSSEWYYQCTPSLTTKTASATVTSAAAAAAFAGSENTLAAAAAAAAVMAQSNYDSLTIQRLPNNNNVPASRRPVVRVQLTRQGVPVEGTVVQVTIMTTKRKPGQPELTMAVTATVEATTKEGGVASVIMPRRVMGAAADTSMISAVTAGARARGVKGTIVVSADDLNVTWV